MPEGGASVRLGVQNSGSQRKVQHCDVRVLRLSQIYQTDAGIDLFCAGMPRVPPMHSKRSRNSIEARRSTSISGLPPAGATITTLGCMPDSWGVTSWATRQSCRKQCWERASLQAANYLYAVYAKGRHCACCRHANTHAGGSNANAATPRRR
jgi:hypothetical protein